MVENIKGLFNRLLDENKKEVAKAIADEFGITLTYARQNYLWGGDIPEDRQYRILDIVRNAAKLQEDKTNSIYAETIEVKDPQEVK